jgi:hypothetical protein
MRVNRVMEQYVDRNDEEEEALTYVDSVAVGEVGDGTAVGEAMQLGLAVGGHAHDKLEARLAPADPGDVPARCRRRARGRPCGPTPRRGAPGRARSRRARSARRDGGRGPGSPRGWIRRRSRCGARKARGGGAGSCRPSAAAAMTHGGSSTQLGWASGRGGQRNLRRGLNHRGVGEDGAGRSRTRCLARTTGRE